MPVCSNVPDRGTSKLVEMDPDCTNRILALRSDSSFPVTQSKNHQQSTSFDTLILDKMYVIFTHAELASLCALYTYQVGALSL